MAKDIKYEIVEEVVVLSESGNWSKKLTKTSWNGESPKLDIRSWNTERDLIGKGLTLTDEEADILCRALQDLGFGK